MTSQHKLITGMVILCVGGFGTGLWWYPRYLVSKEAHPIKNCIFAWAFDDYLSPNAVSLGRRHLVDYPNAEGSSTRSLKLAFTNGYERFVDPIVTTYGYVPGLRTDDPRDLIMLYLRKPTKLASGKDISSYWHVVMRRRMWAVLPHFIEDEHSDIPILLTTSEFRHQLQKTLDFVRENKRPYWEQVVKEHTAFLSQVTED